MGIQWFLIARGSQRHNAQPDSRELSRANQEALAEVDLGTWVSNSSKLSLELFGDFRTQHRCLFDFFMPGESCPTTKQMEARATTLSPGQGAKARSET